MRALGSATLAVLFSGALAAQSQSFFSGVPVTGQLARARTVNLMQLATSQTATSFRLFYAPPEPPAKVVPLLHPPRATQSVTTKLSASAREAVSALISTASPSSASLTVNPVTKA